MTFSINGLKIKQFYDLINSLDKYLKFIFGNQSRSLIFLFLDIQLNILNHTLAFDIYYKPTNSFNNLTYSSCYSSHTKNNVE